MRNKKFTTGHINNSLIVPNNGKERTGYPTQKVIQILKRIITATSYRGETVLDFFAGSGTTGAAFLELEGNII